MAEGKSLNLLPFIAASLNQPDCWDCTSRSIELPFRLHPLGRKQKRQILALVSVSACQCVCVLPHRLFRRGSLPRASLCEKLVHKDSRVFSTSANPVLAGAHTQQERRRACELRETKMWETIATVLKPRCAAPGIIARKRVRMSRLSQTEAEAAAGITCHFVSRQTLPRV